MNENLITPELYDAHPEYADVGLKVGDSIPVPLTPEQMADTEDFEVTQEFLDENPDCDFEIGEIIQIPKKPSVQAPVSSLQPPEASTSPSEPVQVPKVKIYCGKTIISDGFRMVEGNKFHHLKLEDGSTCDLNDADYQIHIANQ